MFYEVIPSRILGNKPLLTYQSSHILKPGQVVRIPLGKSLTNGLVLHQVARPSFPTKTISKVLYDTPLPSHLLKITQFLNKYYLIPLPLTLSLLFPTGIHKNRRLRLPPQTKKPLQTPEIPLNLAQKTALKKILNAPESTKLLHGVTGSGKTNIYLKMAQITLKQQKSILVLVPEIALTSQLVQIFSDFFDQRVVLIHSRQTEAYRHQIWSQLLNSSTPKIIIGPRSALFTPIHNLGLIIIDECHEPSFFQENSPKYSALRIASFIAQTLKISCILGSATPLLQDYYLARSRKSLISLTQKAKHGTTSPKIKIIDSKNRDNFSKNRYLSTELLNSITKNLTTKQQSLIFHNRRGSAPLSLCETCGQEFLCPHCILPLTLHADTFQLICHTCGLKQLVPHSCPHCHSPHILHKGFGTKLLESELKKLFPKAKIARFDADNKKSETLDSLYDKVKSGHFDILIGTQTIAKGLDLPNLATVGIVQADAGLSLPDFTAEERVFTLLTQVIGRVGRGHLNQANVFIQTFRPDHPIIHFALNSNYLNFANYLLQKRRQGSFPPFFHLAKIDITMKTETIVLKKIQTLHHTLSQNHLLSLSAPTPVFHEHSSNGYTWQLLVRAKNRSTLLKALNNLDSNFRLTLDPPSLL